MSLQQFPEHEFTFERFKGYWDGLCFAHNKPADIPKTQYWFKTFTELKFDDRTVQSACYRLRREDRFPNYKTLTEEMYQVQNRYLLDADEENPLPECHEKNRIGGRCADGLVTFFDAVLPHGKHRDEERELSEVVANCKHCCPGKRPGLYDYSVHALLWDKGGSLWTQRGYAQRLRQGGVYVWDGDTKMINKFVADDPDKPDRAEYKWREAGEFVNWDHNLLWLKTVNREESQKTLETCDANMKRSYALSPQELLSKKALTEEQKERVRYRLRKQAADQTEKEFREQGGMDDE